MALYLKRESLGQPTVGAWIAIAIAIAHTTVLVEWVVELVQARNGRESGCR